MADEPVDEVQQAITTIAEAVVPSVEHDDDGILLLLARAIIGDMTAEMSLPAAREQVLKQFAGDLYYFVEDWFAQSIEMADDDLDAHKRTRLKPTVDVVETL